MIPLILSFLICQKSSKGCWDEGMSSRGKSQAYAGPRVDLVGKGSVAGGWRQKAQDQGTREPGQCHLWTLVFTSLVEVAISSRLKSRPAAARWRYCKGGPGTSRLQRDHLGATPVFHDSSLSLGWGACSWEQGAGDRDRFRSLWVLELQLPGQVHTVMLPLMSALMGVNTGEPRQSGGKTTRDI